MTGGAQEISLGPGCYREPVTAMHEIGHAIGTNNILIELILIPDFLFLKPRILQMFLKIMF